MVAIDEDDVEAEDVAEEEVMCVVPLLPVPLVPPLILPPTKLFERLLAPFIPSIVVEDESKSAVADSLIACNMSE